jgi:aspartokinase-like uncharacterized kinase
MMQHSSSVAVVKLGGSLLNVPDLPRRLERLLSAHSETRPVLIVGGGAPVDGVRDWARAFSLGEAAAHELALQAMDLTATLATKILPRASIVASFDEAKEAWADGALPVFSPWSSDLRASILSSLPQSWAVTSDSLAAWTAIQWQAEALWLLKSINSPVGIGWHEAAGQGVVDEFFPVLSARLSQIFWCNLRADALRLERV